MHEKNLPIQALGPDFYDEVQAAVFPQRILRYRNQEAAQELHFDHLNATEWENHFARFEPLPHNLPSPLALRYHGHQFLSYNPDLGDGRGFLFAQIQSPRGLLDLGTKGSGQTPYSRRGDGRLTLKGAFREILATELLESYGVRTSRTLSVFETGEFLQRNDEPSPTRAGVLVRVCHSHLRFGTFQRLAYLNQIENLKKLTEYSLRFYYPEIATTDEAEKAALFLQSVCRRSADLVASWMMSGFVHGVMNTDNMNITGESFDYGPYRLLPTYDPSFTAAYFDHQGLYSFGRQPITMAWNLEQLALSLQKAFPNLPSQEILESFAEDFNSSVHKFFFRRLNLIPPENPGELLSLFFTFLEKEKPGYEQTFFDLHSGLQKEKLERSPQKDLYRQDSFKKLREALMPLSPARSDLIKHPYFTHNKPCTLLIEEIEALWKPIADEDDWSPFNKKLQDIRAFRDVYR